jgi:hypothetical protein
MIAPNSRVWDNGNVTQDQPKPKAKEGVVGGSVNLSFDDSEALA